MSNTEDQQQKQPAEQQKQRATGTGEIRGEVIDKIVRRPLAFATVGVSGTETKVGCDKDGNYTISQIPAGSYAVEASMTGYVSEKAQDVSVSVDVPAIVDFSLGPVAIFDLKERTPYYLKVSIFATLIGLIIACLIVPNTAPKPYKRRSDVVVTQIELPPQLKQLEEPPPPPKPEMPVAAESEEDVEASTIDRTDFSGFEKAPPVPQASEVFAFWAVEEKPVLIQKYFRSPDYPDFARKAEIEGRVTLELVLDTTGCVIDIKILKSLHELLDQAAVKAARGWRYTPARQRDKAVRVRVTQTVNFNLNE
jgi:protein TonB